MIFAVDFDGTIVTHDYPGIGEEIPGALDTLRHFREISDSIKLILWTCRCGKYLEEAVQWCEDRGFVWDAVNDNIVDYKGEVGFPKVCADVYIDDRGYDWVVKSDRDFTAETWVYIRKHLSAYILNRAEKQRILTEQLKRFDD